MAVRVLVSSKVLPLDWRALHVGGFKKGQRLRTKAVVVLPEGEHSFTPFTYAYPVMVELTRLVNSI